MIRSAGPVGKTEEALPEKLVASKGLLLQIYS